MPSTVQDCQSLAEQQGLKFASYYDDGNGAFDCVGFSSCDTVVSQSGWTIYHLGNEYKLCNIYRITYFVPIASLKLLATSFRVSPNRGPSKLRVSGISNSKNSMGM